MVLTHSYRAKRSVKDWWTCSLSRDYNYMLPVAVTWCYIIYLLPLFCYLGQTQTSLWSTDNKYSVIRLRRWAWPEARLEDIKFHIMHFIFFVFINPDKGTLQIKLHMTGKAPYWHSCLICVCMPMCRMPVLFREASFLQICYYHTFTGHNVFRM